MSASMGTELKAEPNLTPLLDVAFQLITFFMLVINFSSENYDQRVRLPIADSARPVDDDQRVSEDRERQRGALQGSDSSRRIRPQRISDFEVLAA